MTEDEAKMKTCCGPQLLTLALVVNAPSIELTENPGRCVASACMAWRWVREDDFPMGSEPWKPKTAGYCGLAGYDQ